VTASGHGWDYRLWAPVSAPAPPCRRARERSGATDAFRDASDWWLTEGTAGAPRRAMPRSFRAGTAEIQPRTVGPQFVEKQDWQPARLLVGPSRRPVCAGETSAVRREQPCPRSSARWSSVRSRRQPNFRRCLAAPAPSGDQGVRSSRGCLATGPLRRRPVTSSEAETTARASCWSPRFRVVAEQVPNHVPSGRRSGGGARRPVGLREVDLRGTQRGDGPLGRDAEQLALEAAREEREADRAHVPRPVGGR
jgi:hypothetical protein